MLSASGSEANRWGLVGIALGLVAGILIYIDLSDPSRTSAIAFLGGVISGFLATISFVYAGVEGSRLWLFFPLGLFPFFLYWCVLLHMGAF